MSLANQLVDEMKELIKHLTDGKHEFSIAGDTRLVVCFKGENAESAAREYRNQLPATSVVIGTYSEQGTYCLVL